LTGLTDLPLGVEQGGEIHFAGFVTGQRRLESQFGLRQQAGCSEGLGSPGRIEAGQVLSQFAQNLVGGGVATGFAADNMASDSRSWARREPCCRGRFSSTISSHSFTEPWYWIGETPSVKSG
jgi:hypothetical protein